MEDTIRTKEISEAAVFYLNGLRVNSYINKHWVFDGDIEVAKSLRLSLFNRKITVEPLEFLEAVRRLKAFSNDFSG